VVGIIQIKWDRASIVAQRAGVRKIIYKNWNALSFSGFSRMTIQFEH
jgi:hypothetical protein